MRLIFKIKKIHIIGDKIRCNLFKELLKCAKALQVYILRTVYDYHLK